MKDKNMLQKLLKGSGIIFFIAVCTYFFNFFIRLILSRNFTPEQYGLITLGEMVLGVSSLFALIGLHSAMGKYIPHFLKKGDKQKVKGILIATFSIVILSSLILSAILYFSRNFLSINVFHNEAFTLVLTLFILAIPFNALFWLFNSIFVAFKKPEFSFVSTVIGRQLPLLLLIGFVVFMEGSIFRAAIAFPISYLISAILSFIVLEWKIFPLFRSKIKASYMNKKLLYFSAPLLFSGLFVNSMAWADTFFLGTLLNTRLVGIYNIAISLAMVVKIFLSSFETIFYPLASEQYAAQEFEELEVQYATVTRWIFLASLPFLGILLIIPGPTLGILFGASYAEGALALIVLTIANTIDIFLGPSVKMLMTMGRTKSIFKVNIIFTIFNVILNFLLIPSLGILGAALATGVTIIFRKGSLFMLVRGKFKIKYSIRTYLKYIFSIIIAGSLLLFSFSMLKQSVYSLFGLCSLYLGVYILLLFTLKAFKAEDIDMIKAILKRLGIK